ncbi:RNA-directed DNA polymerase, eukaryota, reverse transcriptase zinc-binding domain protein [Tanacetum coccineum]
MSRDGWTWVFGKNKKQHSKPIDNPFVKDVEKIATSFFVTNFPESLDAKSLWKEFQPFGRIVDAFIANKRSKIGKHFGFVRFLGICNGGELVKTFSNIWIESYHVYVSTTKFQRQVNTESNPKKNVRPDPHSYVTPLRPNSSNNSPPVFPSKWSYASVANGSAAPKRFPNNDVHESSKRDYRYGFKTCEAFKSNDSLKSFWATIKTVSPSFIVGERLIWIEIAGLPLFSWGSNDLKKVTSLFRKFKFFDSEEADAMSIGRVCIATKFPSCISETVSVVIHGKTFDVHVKEVGT